MRFLLTLFYGLAGALLLTYVTHAALELLLARDVGFLGSASVWLVPVLIAMLAKK